MLYLFFFCRLPEIFSAASRNQLAAEDSLFGADAADNEGVVLLTYAWRCTCSLIEELLRGQEQAVVGPAAQQLHAITDALVIGLLAS